MLITAIFYSAVLLLIFYLLARICDEYFVASLDIIAKKLKLPEDVAGATLMAVGSSIPEFCTALIAVFLATEEVGAGTIVGSAIFNILVIVGGSALISSAFLKWQPVIRDIGFYILSIILLLVTFIDGVITLPEAVAYIILYAIYIAFLWWWSRKFPSPVTDELDELAEEVEEITEELEQRQNLWGKFNQVSGTVLDLFFPNLERKPSLYWITFLVSIAMIAVLSWGLVESGVRLAEVLHVPAVIISLTILAGGTSVPDLISSLLVARNGRGDMAVSNAIGSNSFDILICLGLPWLLSILAFGGEIHVGTENLLSSILLLFFTVIAVIVLLVIQRFKLNRRLGVILIFIYGGYLIYSVLSALQ